MKNQKVNLLHSKLSDSLKEKSHLNERLSKCKTEMDKLNFDYDHRVKDIILLKRENEKLKEVIHQQPKIGFYEELKKEEYE